MRHSSDREPPFAINVGLLLYAKTRKRQLIDALVQHGICISYDRALEISTQLGESVLSQVLEDSVVCPAVLQKGMFTTSAVDNINHNLSATTATQHLHFMALIYLFFSIHFQQLSQTPQRLNFIVKNPKQKLSVVFLNHIQM